MFIGIPYDPFVHFGGFSSHFPILLSIYNVICFIAWLNASININFQSSLSLDFVLYHALNTTNKHTNI